jgi:hypothetical protein
MEECGDIVQVGNFKLELKVHDNEGFSIIFTAHDDENRRVIRAPIMEGGNIKIYSSAKEAVSDAMTKLGCIPF